MNSDRLSPNNAKADPPPIASQPVKPERSDSSASTLIEAPQGPAARRRLDAHEFADGGGSGGAEAFSRKRLRR